MCGCGCVWWDGTDLGTFETHLLTIRFHDGGRSTSACSKCFGCDRFVGELSHEIAISRALYTHATGISYMFVRTLLLALLSRDGSRRDCTSERPRVIPLIPCTAPHSAARDHAHLGHVQRRLPGDALRLPHAEQRAAAAAGAAGGREQRAAAAVGGGEGRAARGAAARGAGERGPRGHAGRAARGGGQAAEEDARVRAVAARAGARRQRPVQLPLRVSASSKT